MAEARAVEAEGERAKAEAVTTFLTEMLGSVDPAQARGRVVSVREALDAAAAKIDAGAMRAQPAVESAVRNTIGSTYAGLGLYAEAERQLRAAAALQLKAGAGPLERGDTENRLVNVLYQARKFPEAIKAAELAVDLRRQALGPEALGNDHPEIATRLTNLVVLLGEMGKRDLSEPLANESVAIRRKVQGGRHPIMANTLDAYAA